MCGGLGAKGLNFCGRVFDLRTNHASYLRLKNRTVSVGDLLRTKLNGFAGASPVPVPLILIVDLEGFYSTSLFVSTPHRAVMLTTAQLMVTQSCRTDRTIRKELMLLWII